MPSHANEDGFEVTRETLSDRVEAFFDDLEPHTAAEVASGLGVSTSTAVSELDGLVGEDRLQKKTVGDELTIWYRDRSPGASTRESAPTDDGPSDETVEARVDAAVEGLEVPGTSEMMRSWRRDAVRAAAEYLVDQGSAAPEGVKSAVYPGHAAGFDDADDWWEMVAPRLRQVPGVEERSETLSFDRRRTSQ